MWAKISKDVIIPLAIKLGEALVQWAIKQVNNSRANRDERNEVEHNNKVNALNKAIANAKTDKERIALSSVLSDINS